MIKKYLIIINFRFSETETFLNYVNATVNTIGGSAARSYEHIFKNTSVPKMRLTLVFEPMADYYFYRVSNMFYYAYLKQSIIFLSITKIFHDQIRFILVPFISYM